MADIGHQLTDKELDELEARIYGVYKSAHDDLAEVIADYFAKFEKRDKEMLALLNEGKITEEKYKQWRLAQMGRGERYKALQKKIADRMLNANQTAVAYMNDATPGIYSLNYNYSAYTIEQANEGVDFTLYDEQTVRRLVADDPELWPRPRIDIPADQLWNKQNVRNAITSGILLGEGIGKIASRLERVTDMNRNAAIRNARTAVTGAQNAGRQASYDRAAEMGIKVRKKWVATIDKRTRHSHAELDGKIVAYNEKFRSILGSEMMYPGDREGKPADVYNCRCTVSTVEKDGIEAEPRMRRVRDPVTGKNVVVQGVTYSEWISSKSQLTKSPLNAKIQSSKEIPDIVIGRSLGAKAKNYDIKLPNREIVHLTEGTRVSHIQVIAGKGRNRKIDEVPVLLSRYPGSVESEWQKLKGIGYVDYDGESYKAELHWYEEPSWGRVEWKVKPDAAGNWFIEED